MSNEKPEYEKPFISKVDLEDEVDLANFLSESETLESFAQYTDTGRN